MPFNAFFPEVYINECQINHSPSITKEDYAYEIKGAGLFSRDQIFSLRSPIPVKAGQQVSQTYYIQNSSLYQVLPYFF